MMKIGASSIFGIGLIVLCGMFLITAVSYTSVAAKMVPIIVLAVTLVFLVLQLASEIVPAFGDRIKFITSGGLMCSFESQIGNQSSSPKSTERSLTEEIKLFIWLFFLVITTYIFGFLIGNGVFLFLFLRFRAKQSWVTTIGITAGAMVFIWVIFGELLRMPLAPGWFS